MINKEKKEVFDVFVFQAEDGIRDRTVTGVQTCALPIFHVEVQLRRRAGRPQLKRDPLGGNNEGPAVKASVFVGTSLDGFIARANGELDFLPGGGGEPHGYDEFMATVDALVIGRKTFQTVLTFGSWPYGEKPVFVLSTHELAPTPPGAMVQRMSGAPA